MDQRRKRLYKEAPTHRNSYYSPKKCLLESLSGCRLDDKIAGHHENSRYCRQTM
jgi:hypothetical protein